METRSEARAAVAALAALGVDFLAVGGSLGPEAYLGMAEEARRRAIPWSGRLPEALSPLDAAASGQRSIDGGVLEVLAPCVAGGRDRLRRRAASLGRGEFAGYFRRTLEYLEAPDPEGCAELREELRLRGVWLVPTTVRELAVPSPLSVGSPYLPAPLRRACRRQAEGAGRVPEALREDHLRAFLDEVGRWREAGLPILPGSGAPGPCLVPGVALHDELGRLVEAGFSPAEALRAATAGAARFLGTADSLGAVAEGKLADLVLLARNPLEEVENSRTVRAVVLRGRLLDMELLRRGLERAAGFAGGAAPGGG